MQDQMVSRRELQLASIPDIQGSIQANDTKSSAALVVHGLLFAGVVSIVANLGDTYDEATLGARVAGIGILVVAAGFFGRSVFALIGAAEPHDPESTRDAIKGRHAEAFFPPAHPTKLPPGGCRGFDQQLERLATLKTDDDFEREYAAEQVKLADIRVTQAHAAKQGFRWLRYEIFAAGLFLLLVVLVALDAPALAKDDSASNDLELSWRIFEGTRQNELSGSGTAMVRSAPLTVRLVARGHDVDRVDISGALVSRCDRRGVPTAAVIQPVTADAQPSDDTRNERIAQYTLGTGCPKGTKQRVEGSVSGHAAAGSAVRRVQLTLQSP